MNHAASEDRNIFLQSFSSGFEKSSETMSVTLPNLHESEKGEMLGERDLVAMRSSKMAMC